MHLISTLATMVLCFATADDLKELEVERLLAHQKKNLIYSVKHEDNTYALKIGAISDLLKHEHKTLCQIHKLAAETGTTDLQISISHEYGSIDGNTAILIGPLGEKFSYPKTFSELMDIVVQLADTLQKIHRLGYVHTGIREDNLIVVDKKIFLIDFERAVKIGGELPCVRIPTPFYVEYGVAYVSEDWFQLMYFIYTFFDKDYYILSNTRCSKSMFPEHPHLQEVYDYLLENHESVDDDKVVSMLQKVVAIQSKL